jgi:hypothetical protein
MSDHNSDNNNDNNDNEEDTTIKILEYAYDCFKKIGYTTLHTKLDSILSNAFSSNNGQIEFQIISKGEDHEAFSVNIESDNLARLEQFIEAVRHPDNYYDLSHDEWQMTVDVPNELSKEQIENGLDTDEILSYLGAQAWIDKYSQDEQFFLFNRRNLKAKLRRDQEGNNQQIVFLFYRSEDSENKDEHEVEVEEPVKDESEKGKENVGMSSMKSNMNTVKKTAKDMRVPSKYDNQRQPPQEVPLDVIRCLFLAIDQDMDDRISAQEILKYIHKTKLTIENEVAYELFDE